MQHRGVAQPGRALGSGPRGRRFKSCLPDILKAATLLGFPMPSRPSPFLEPHPRTTGAPNCVTPCAENAPGAGTSGREGTVDVAPVFELPSAIPAFLEACGKLAGEALRRGDNARALALIDLAWRVASANDRER